MIRRFAQDDSAATSIEYALIATIVSLSIIVGLAAMRDVLNLHFDNVTTALSK